MKIRIGNFSIDFNEASIRKARRESYVKGMVKTLAWTGIDPEVLAEKVGQVYDAVRK